jgi:hypothetical protein
MLHTKTFYKVQCDGRDGDKDCEEMLTDGETYWWDKDSIEPMIDEDGYWLMIKGPLADRHYCHKHWAYCECCDGMFPRTDMAQPDDMYWQVLCRACREKQSACGNSTGHMIIDQGYTNANGQWVEVLMCTRCDYLKHEGVVVVKA